MICVQPSGWLGNDIGQYCFGRLLAEKFGYMMLALPIPGFPETFLDIPGEMFFGPSLRIGGQWPQDIIRGRKLEPEELATPPSCSLEIDGYFQRSEFYRLSEKRIKNKWLVTVDDPKVRSAKDFAICIRTRKQKTNDPNTTFNKDKEFDAACMMSENDVRRLSSLVQYERLYIITDDSNHPMINAVRDVADNIIVGKPFEQFMAARSFKKVAFSQDSLFWWATFLGAAREIYFPKCHDGYWSKPEIEGLDYQPWWHGINLKVCDDSRYVYDW